MGSLTGTYIAYKFVRLMSQPFDEWDAFKNGTIDSKGKLLKKAHTPKEKDDWTKFHIIVRNVKRVLAKIPGGGGKFATFAAALWLIKEEYSDGSSKFDSIIMEHFGLTSYQIILEEDNRRDVIERGLYEGVYDNVIYNVKEDTEIHARFLGKNIYLLENHNKEIVAVTKDIIKL